MKIEKIEELVANLHDKIEYVIHIRNFKQTLNHEFVLKKVYKVIKFHENASLEPYIDMNTDLRKKERMILKNISFKLMSNAVFGKFFENLRKYRDIKLVTTEKRMNYFMSEPNYHTTKFFTENLSAVEMKKQRCI